MPSKYFFLRILFFTTITLFAQKEKDSISSTVNDQLVIDNAVIKREPLDPLRPSKAAFLSAVLPGLGQVYNKKYWKVPIVVGAITGGILVYNFNTKQLNRYRDAYKRRLAGFTDDEFYFDSDGNLLETPTVSTEGLLRVQRSARRNRELSLLITVGIYALNIIDANVDAHLLQYNVDENLAIRPHFKYNEMENSSDLGVTLNFKF